MCICNGTYGFLVGGLPYLGCNKYVMLYSFFVCDLSFQNNKSRLFNNRTIVFNLEML